MQVEVKHKCGSYTLTDGAWKWAKEKHDKKEEEEEQEQEKQEVGDASTNQRKEEIRASVRTARKKAAIDRQETLRKANSKIYDLLCANAASAVGSGISPDDADNAKERTEREAAGVFAKQGISVDQAFDGVYVYDLDIGGMPEGVTQDGLRNVELQIFLTEAAASEGPSTRYRLRQHDDHGWCYWGGDIIGESGENMNGESGGEAEESASSSTTTT